MKTRICFVGSDNYPVLNPASGDDYFGGESVQQTLLARAFVKQAFDVSMVVSDFGQPDGEEIDNIRIWKMMRKGSGVPVLRFIHPRLTSIIRALKKADADIYYQSCAGMLTGVVAWFCKRYDRKFIFRVAHDTDCIPGKYIIERHYWRDSRIYEYGLKNADYVAVQSAVQKGLLERNYSLDSRIVNMAVQPPDITSPIKKKIDILWVNNLRSFKRPELVIELAKMLPKYQFVMIGGPVQKFEKLFEDISEQARNIANLRFLGAVPYHQVNDYFLKSKVFVNTSDSEGFPNSFLQAWVRGVPVFSFFDPDGLIENCGLGAAPGGLEDMAIELDQTLKDNVKLHHLSEHTQEFAMGRYAPDSVAKNYIDWMTQGANAT